MQGIYRASALLLLHLLSVGNAENSSVYVFSDANTRRLNLRGLHPHPPKNDKTKNDKPKKIPKKCPETGSTGTTGTTGATGTTGSTGNCTVDVSSIHALIEEAYRIRDEAANDNVNTPNDRALQMVSAVDLIVQAAYIAEMMPEGTLKGHAANGIYTYRGDVRNGTADGLGVARLEGVNGLPPPGTLAHAGEYTRSIADGLVQLSHPFGQKNFAGQYGARIGRNGLGVEWDVAGNVTYAGWYVGNQQSQVPPVPYP